MSEQQQDSSDEQPLSGLTFYQSNLLDEAKDMWERGHRIPLTLYSDMAREGMDVQTLEETYYKESRK